MPFFELAIIHNEFNVLLADYTPVEENLMQSIFHVTLLLLQVRVVVSCDVVVCSSCYCCCAVLLLLPKNCWCQQLCCHRFGRNFFFFFAATLGRFANSFHFIPFVNISIICSFKFFFLFFLPSHLRLGRVITLVATNKWIKLTKIEAFATWNWSEMERLSLVCEWFF